MAWGWASRTTISKDRRYRSRAARLETWELELSRFVSWLLKAKCLTVTPRPGCPCTPRVMPAATRPASSGSSERYSKLRPHRMERCRLKAGASHRWAPKWSISAPTRSP